MYKTIVVDIDGTISSCEHRLHYVTTKPKNWKAFYAGMEHDLPIQPVIDAIYSMYIIGYDVVFCTGRPEEYRKITKEWIVKNTIFVADDNLYMRPSKDNRADNIVKEELLDKIIADGYNPVIAFEDRGRVIEMYRRRGLYVFNTNQGEDF